MTLDPGLYVTATPIGNLGDMTYRAVETLRGCDVILCEDTRQTGKLCAAFEISTARRPYHDHNAGEVRPDILRQLKAGARIALVSDAGTPLISDPGYKLVDEAREAGVNVFAVPGPSAVIAGLSVAGLPSDRFMFVGFLPPKSGARRNALAPLAQTQATLVFYEAPSRLAACLRDMADTLPGRHGAVARELTKLHEEVMRGTFAELADHYEANAARGEIVIMAGPPAEVEASVEDVDAFIESALGEMSVKDAAAVAAQAFSIPRKEAYEAALRIKAALKSAG